MKTVASRETEASSPGAAPQRSRGVAVCAPGHGRPAVAQRQSSGDSGAVAGLAAKPVQASKAPLRTGLPDPLRSAVETLSGIGMEDVRVHYNSPRPAQLQALAYTEGADIHVGPGQEKHLPHEAWHVVQQKQGRVRATLQMKGVALNDDDALEREADRIGARAIQQGAVAFSPGCGCASCAKGSGVPGGGPHRILPVARQIGQPSIIQKVKCEKCETRLKSNQTQCPVCGYKTPVKAASAPPSKSDAGAASAASKSAADKKAAADKNKVKAPAPTHSIRVQLQLVNPKVEMSEVVHHYDGKPITQDEAIAALNRLLQKANGVVGNAILTTAYAEVGPKVVTRIKQGAIAQSASTYFTTKADKNRIDVENMRGAENFSPGSGAAAAAAAAN